MTTFYLTRHGETEWNTQRRMQGHMNSDLTQQGIVQAKALGKSLKDIPFSCIYSSSAGRAMQTSQAINEALNLKIIPHDGLKEIHLGHWEGKTKHEIEAFDAEQYYHFWNEPHRFIPSSGENFLDVTKRTAGVLEQLARFHPGDTLLVVTHAVVLKGLLMYFEDKPLDQFWTGPMMHPTSLTVVEREPNGWKLQEVGNTDHYSLIEL